MGIADRFGLSMLIGKLIDIAKADRSCSNDELTMIDPIGETLGIGDLARKRIVGVLGYDPFELG